MPVLGDQGLPHLKRHLVLLILGCWFKTGWVGGVHLGVISKGVLILTWRPLVFNVIAIASVFLDQRLLHLKRHIVLLILWCWLKSCWSSRINLRKSIIILSIVTDMIQMLVGVVHVLKIICIHLVRPVERMVQLGIQWVVILVVWWGWLETRGMSWVDLGQRLLIVCRLVVSLDDRAGWSSLRLLDSLFR